MVFRSLDGVCPCGCGQPIIDIGSESENYSANTNKEARDNHMRMIKKYYEIEFPNIKEIIPTSGTIRLRR